MTQFPSKTVLSDDFIRAFPPVTSDRCCVRDNQLSQFTLMVGPRSKTFYLHATMHRRTHRVRLGPWPIVSADEARDRCLTALRALYRGESARVDKPKMAPTLAEVLTDYLSSRSLAAQSASNLRSVIAVHAAAWADKPIDELDARTIAKRYKAVAADSRSAGNRLLGALSALTRYARAAHGVGDDTLIQRVRALLGGVEQVAARDVVIFDDLQGRWAKSVAGESAQVGRYLQCLMLTGLRANELRKLPLSGWNAAAASIAIATTKNKKPHSLPAGALLQSLMSQEAATVGASGLMFDIPEKVYRAACDRIGKAIGLDWHLHDLRRTFATTATRCGIDGSTLKRLMNHSTGGDVTARHYVKFTLDDLRPAMQAIEGRFVELWAHCAA